MKTDKSPGALTRLLDEGDFHQRGNNEFWLEQEASLGQDIYSQILFHLTRLEFDARQAKDHWLAILERRRNLVRLLGRQAALRTAVLDYFLSDPPIFDDPVVVESRILLKTEQLSLMDELTGLYNRRYFNAALDKELERARRTHRPCAMLMADIDRFKVFNDSFGHQAGDAVLRQVSRILMDQSRLVDHVTRFGGEEFAIILPLTSRIEARQVAERLRRSVQDHMFMDAGRPLGRLTVSLGLATHPDDAGSARELVARADQALYMAKGMGRNQVYEINQDKRRHPRFPLKLSARLLARDDGQAAVPGRTVNISQGGMLYETDRPVDVGRRVETVLSDPGNGLTLPIMSRTVHLAPMTTGGAFHVGVAIEPDTAWHDLYRAFVVEMTGAWR